MESNVNKCMLLNHNCTQFTVVHTVLHTQSTEAHTVPPESTEAHTVPLHTIHCGTHCTTVKIVRPPPIAIEGR
jgi:hypothetical protein